jgi:hypothetical protein
MKIGAEDRNKLIAAVVLMVLAAVALYTLVFRPATPPAAAAATPSARVGTARAPRNRPGAPAATGQEELDPTLRLALLHATENVTYEGTGRDIFRAQAEEPLPKAIKPALTDKRTPTPTPTPTGPPPPPPINLKFYGFANKPGDPTKKIFLSEGENIFIASEGDVVNRRYKVVKIGQTSVEIEDLLNNNRQSIPLS